MSKKIVFVEHWAQVKLHVKNVTQEKKILQQKNTEKDQKRGKSLTFEKSNIRLPLKDF